MNSETVNSDTEEDKEREEKERNKQDSFRKLRCSCERKAGQYKASFNPV